LSAKKNPQQRPPKPPSGNSIVTHTTHQEWSGALPPPAALQQFDGIIKDGAERIMRMAEQEQTHRQEMEQIALSSDVSTSRRALQIEIVTRAIGGLVLLACVGGSIYCASIGQTWPAVALVGLPVMTAIGLLIRGHAKRQDKQ